MDWIKANKWRLSLDKMETLLLDASSLHVKGVQAVLEGVCLLPKGPDLSFEGGLRSIIITRSKGQLQCPGPHVVTCV